MASLAGPGGHGCEPPLPVPPRLPARRAAGNPRGQGHVVRRMDVGRDTGAGREAGRYGLYLVPGRGAAWPGIPRACGRSGESAGWHGDRRGDSPRKDGSPLPFSLLQKRIGRQSPTRKVLEEIPVIFIAFDLLELQGRDIRTEPLRKRRAELETILGPAVFRDRIRLSEVLRDATWEDLTAKRRECRSVQAGGILLKRVNSLYEAGRHQGSWWKWKIEPHTIDAVLIYAQRGHGQRESLFTDYTFGVWLRGELVPVAKTGSGLTDEEIERVDAFTRQNTLEKFGPVRSVEPRLVFEIAFDGIETSARRKSGLTVRSPRIVKWKDKPPEEADTLEALKVLLRKGAD